MSSFIPINLGGGTMSVVGADKAFTERTYVNETGDSMRGNLNMGPHRLIVTEPVHPNDAVNMSFLENSISKNLGVVNSKLGNFEKELRTNVKTVWESISISIDEKIKKETGPLNERILLLTNIVNENKKMEKEISFISDNLRKEIKLRNENEIIAQADRENAIIARRIDKENIEKGIKVLMENVAVLEKQIKIDEDKEKAEIAKKISKENMINDIKNEIRLLGNDMIYLKQELKSLTKKNPK